MPVSAPSFNSTTNGSNNGNTQAPSQAITALTPQHQVVPLIVMAGWRSGWFMPALLAKRLRKHTGRDDSTIIAVSFPTCGSIPLAAYRLVQTIQNHWPSNNPGYTTKVDIAAVSMAGLASRFAALPPSTRQQLTQLQTTPKGSTPNQTTASVTVPATSHAQTDTLATLPTLHIRNLFTIATPHRGARLAKYIAPDAAAKAMRPGCPFLAALDQATPAIPYTLTCYARTRDFWVGQHNTAPKGQTPITYKAPPLTLSHLCVTMDKRIAADIASRVQRSE